LLISQLRDIEISLAKRALIPTSKISKSEILDGLLIWELRDIEISFAAPEGNLALKGRHVINPG